MGKENEEEEEEDMKDSLIKELLSMLIEKEKLRGGGGRRVGEKLNALAWGNAIGRNGEIFGIETKLYYEVYPLPLL